MSPRVVQVPFMNRRDTAAVKPGSITLKLVAQLVGAVLLACALLLAALAAAACA